MSSNPFTSSSALPWLVGVPVLAVASLSALVGAAGGNPIFDSALGNTADTLLAGAIAAGGVAITYSRSAVASVMGAALLAVSLSTTSMDLHWGRLLSITGAMINVGQNAVSDAADGAAQATGNPQASTHSAPVQCALTAEQWQWCATDDPDKTTKNCQRGWYTPKPGKGCLQ